MIVWKNQYLDKIDSQFRKGEIKLLPLQAIIIRTSNKEVIKVIANLKM